VNYIPLLHPLKDFASIILATLLLCYQFLPLYYTTPSLPNLSQHLHAPSPPKLPCLLLLFAVTTSLPQSSCHQHHSGNHSCQGHQQFPSYQFPLISTLINLPQGYNHSHSSLPSMGVTSSLASRTPLLPGSPQHSWIVVTLPQVVFPGLGFILSSLTGLLS
jgi:hypothetical protein